MVDEAKGQNVCFIVIKLDSAIISIQPDNDSYIPGSLAYRRQRLKVWHIDNFVTHFKLHRTGWPPHYIFVTFSLMTRGFWAANSFCPSARKSW